MPRPAAPRRLARALTLLAALTSLAVLATSAVGYALLRQYDGQVTRLPGVTTALPGLELPPAAPGDARNVLLVGSDSRAFDGGEAFQGLGDERVVGQRADTVILAHLYGDSDQAQLVSFPRDAWVTIPAHTDPVTGERRGETQAKLNAAMPLGGPQLLVATIQELSGIRVDHYVQIDFAGFQSLVDALGGVQVCLLEPAREALSGIDLPAGPQTVAGDQALAFVRQRYELPGGDLDRIRRQQHFIGALTRQVLDAGTLLNPFTLDDVLDTATAAVSVDDGLTGGDLTDLALRMRGFAAGGVAFSTVPVAEQAARREGQSVVLLDEAGARALFDGLRADAPPAVAPPAPEVVPLVVRPGAVRVAVFNGAGTPGLGRAAADDLARLGFTVEGAAQDRGRGARTSVVRHGPTKAESAQTLAAAVPGATVELDPALEDTLELVLGSSYAGAAPVTVTPAPSPVDAPATTATTAATDGCVA